MVHMRNTICKQTILIRRGDSQEKKWNNVTGIDWLKLDLYCRWDLPTVDLRMQETSRQLAVPHTFDFSTKEEEEEEEPS